MEKVYKTMKAVGIANIVFGIVITVVSAVIGAFLIVNGSKLMSRKKDIMF